MSLIAEPLRFPSRIEHEAHGGVLIRRVLKRVGLAHDAISAVVELDDARYIPLRAAFVDATGGRSPTIRSGATAFHVLWCVDEPNASVGLGEAGDSPLVQHRISPGDTLYVPPSHPFYLGPGVLGYEVSATSTGGSKRTDLTQPRPTHGLERFEGFNRRTVCAAGPGLVLERWKVTQPLPLSWPADQSLIVTNLVEPIGIVWRGGSDLIGRAESRMLPRRLESCTFIPDGLGYLLISYVPDLVADVISPLREAGHSDAAIATLGDLDLRRV